MCAKTIGSWLLIGVVTLFVSAPFSAAHAKLIKWVLDDVKWDVYDYTITDIPPVREAFSSAASGWFLYDAKTRKIGAWAIKEFTTPPTQFCLDSGFLEWFT